MDEIKTTPHDDEAQPICEVCEGDLVVGYIFGIEEVCPHCKGSGYQFNVGTTEETKKTP